MTLPILERTRQPRFRVGRRLGHGAMGVVYEGWDHKRGRAVALKVYNHDDELTLARVRRIVERLRDLHHVNVVELVDLIEADDAPILVMERVDGEDVMSYCAGRWRSEPPSDGTAQVRCDVARLRSCLVQIVSGLIALHGRGVIHNDLKPANLRVTPEGRLVILDFSLSDDRGQISDASGGTIAYMAPEQAITDGVVGPAADWYALGVIAYQALSGRLPFEGPPQRVLQDKAMREPARVDTLVAGVPADLVALCEATLVPDPDRRPREEDLIRMLGLAPAVSRTPAARAVRPGRQARAIEHAIERLREARATGRAAILAMVGEPGIGRSEVLAEIGRASREIWPDAIVLELASSGGLLDRLAVALANAWAKLGSAEQAAIVPSDAAPLLELLPALGRVPALSSVPHASSSRVEHLRATEAIDALRETLTQLSRRRPVVLLIDDLDELDRDAAIVLADVMRAPDPPPVLMVGTCVHETKVPPIERLSPLPLDWWSRREIETLLQPHGLPEAIHQGVMERCGGNPTLALELARAWTIGETPADGDLAAIVAARIARLSATAREVLLAAEMIGASQPVGVLGAALDIDPTSLDGALDELARAGLVTTVVDARGRGLAPARRAVRAGLATALAAERPRLARAIAAGLDDLAPAIRARLWRDAGEPTRAAGPAAEGAAEARASLRFVAATELYELAIDGGRQDLLLAVAECTAASGDGSAAARGFTRAAANASGAARLALEIRAAEHHVLAGEVDQGITAFRTALATIGISLARTPGAAIPRLLARRAWLRVRGMRFARRAAADLAPRELAGADACFSAAHHLGVLETVVGAELQARALAIALRLGDPERLGHAAVLEALFLISQGAAGRGERLIALARGIAGDIGSARLGSFTVLGEAGLEFFHRNRFEPALALFDARNREVLGEPNPETWALDMAQTYACMTLANLGDIHELARRVHALIREAERRGDRYAATVYRMRTNIAWLARGDEAGADEAIAIAERQWPYGGAYFRVPDYYRMYARVERALWGGDAATAERSLAADLGGLERSMLLRVHHVRAETDSLAARVAIAAAPCGGARRAARRRLAQLRKNIVPEAAAWAALLEGCAALRDGDPAVAAVSLSAAIGLAEAQSLGLLAAAARIRLGEARGNEYSDNVARGLHDLARLGVTEVPRTLAMLAPV